MPLNYRELAEEKEVLTRRYFVSTSVSGSAMVIRGELFFKLKILIIIGK